MAVIKTHPNVAAFLDTLAFSEGTATHPLTRNNGYDVIVTGIDGKPEIFTDYRDHPFAGGRPAKVFNRRGEKSTASGRYQQLYLFWPHYQKQLALPDFSPGITGQARHSAYSGAWCAGRFAAGAHRARDFPLSQYLGFIAGCRIRSA